MASDESLQQIFAAVSGTTMAAAGVPPFWQPAMKIPSTGTITRWLRK
jgi:hypothetical protein